MKLLIGIIIILVCIIIAMLIKWPKVIEISETEPKTLLPKNAWLKFQNEGARYIKHKDGKIYLKIVK